jgi:cell wall assembly regulator SMI1
MRALVDKAERIQAALLRIGRWMNLHGARPIATNLAPGANPRRVTQAEAELGFSVPPELRALWSLHDGQRDTGHSFVGAPRIGDLEFDLLSIEATTAQQELVLIDVERIRESEDEAGATVEGLRTDATTEELQSNHWLAFAALESQSLVMSGVTGRVFFLGDDPLKLLAPSLTDWLEQYAADLEADEYVVEASEGACSLARRDREAEKEAAERAEREAEQGRVRRETPLLDQMRMALASRNEGRCTEVLTDARERNDTRQFDGGIALLFASQLGPRFVASTLRPFLRTVVLQSDQWLDVAIGGVLLANNAVRDVAMAHRGDISVERLKELAAAAARAEKG